MLSREIWVCYQSLRNLEHTESSDAWLSGAERRECARYRDEGRLRQFRAGRYLAKKLLLEQLVPWSVDWSEIEILSRDGQNRAVRPEVTVRGNRVPWCVSISHSRRGVLVGISLNRQIQVGVDLAEKEDLNPKSLVFWFSNRERERLRDAGARPAAVCWAVKEAVYKAVNQGESFVPKKFEVFPREKAGYECRYEGESFKDRSQINVWDVDDHVAVTAIVASSPKLLLEAPGIGGKAEKQPDVTKHILVGVS